jgi:hypothetical protein
VEIEKKDVGVLDMLSLTIMIRARTGPKLTVLQQAQRDGLLASVRAAKNHAIG